MTPDDLCQAYLDFFKKKNHAFLPSASLVPENDPTTLFTGSGMQPLLPYFLGQPHPQGKRVVNSQKCFRSQDIEEVGDNRHTTFFEMLGNWSFGDYFKQEQLKWIFEFFLDVCGLDPQKLYVSVYEGNQELGIPRDAEAAQIWKKLFAEKGITDERVFYYGNQNWWSRVGEPANMSDGEPGGPDSEIFYDFGGKLETHENSQFADRACHLNCDCGRYLEIGNSVFMTYVKTKRGFEELENKNIDFGGGLERILAAMNDDPDVFNTDLFAPIIKVIENYSAGLYANQNDKKAIRVIADHLKAAVFLIKDGVRPSNKEQGYVLRRLLRRAAVKMHDLGGGLTPVPAFCAIAHEVMRIYAEKYFDENLDKVLFEEVIDEELERFGKSLNKGLKVLKKIKILNGKTAFDLYQTFGFPVEIAKEIASRDSKTIDGNLLIDFNQLKNSHARQSRQATIGKFAGGLGDQSEVTIKYHTATHLLHAALRKILGNHVGQKGSNITAERLRFDFSHPQALTLEEINQVETQINTWIEADLPVTKQTMNKQAALDAGAIAFFIEKYPDEVTIYTIGQKSDSDWISKEFCGGPHVDKTSKINLVKLSKEQSCGAGVRRVYVKFE
ncbi:alanine--tRNA ligase [Patescibacteria group bacterium]|nr:alanine--tRNA ligase [Patescibacteria group bacterium]